MAFDAASRYSEWSTIAVTVGVSIEFVALFIFSRDMPSKEKAVMIFATLLIVAGCGGEFIFGSRANDAAVQLQQASDEQIAGLKTETVRLSTAADQARAEIAESNARAKEAEKRANEAELELAKLEASRVLTPDQSATIIKQLKVLLPANCRISIAEPFLDSTDANPFAKSIRDVFSAAEVTLSPSKKLGNVLGWSGPGAWLEVSRLDNIPYAAAVQRAFASADIYLEGNVKPEDLDDPEHVLIIVSSHPLKPQVVPAPLGQAANAH
jgi:hypothetical protein